MYLWEMFVGEVVSKKELGIKIGKIFDDDLKDFESEFGVGFTKENKTIDVSLMHVERT
jgi:hypothetical protein